jgi:hypothetical protein
MRILSRVSVVLAASAVLALSLPAVGATTTSKIVLGATAFAPNGAGFATVKPKRIFNGGDPSGLVSNLTWTHWGAAKAIGTGKTSIFKPGGGYYPHLVRAQLRASKLGHCRAHGPRAYTHLDVRVPAKPGAPLGKWQAWSGVKSICVGP